MRFDVFGTLVAVERVGHGWVAYLDGPEGKRGPADFVIPAFGTEAEVQCYLADLFHEYASPERPDAVGLD